MLPAVLLLAGLLAPLLPLQGDVVLVTTPESFDQAANTLRFRGLDVEAYPVAHTLVVRGAPLGLLREVPGVVRAGADEPAESFGTDRFDQVGAAQVSRSGAVTGAGVTVAIVDAGVDTQHPALRDHVRGTYCVAKRVEPCQGRDDTGHGTHIAGLIVGRDAGGAPIGLAPESQILSLDISAPFTTSSALRAFQWLQDHGKEHDVRVVTNSWGRSREPAVYDPDDPIIRAADSLVQQGFVVVFSTGNEGPEAGRMTLESTNPNVLSVGAVDSRNRVPHFSGRGPVRIDAGLAPYAKPDLVAPGVAIHSTLPAGSFGTMNGTSMAAPQVAAAAALLLSAMPELEPGTVMALLKHTAQDLGPAGPDDSTGYGLLDVGAAVERVLRSNGGRIERVMTWSAEGQSSTLSLASADRGPWTIPVDRTGDQLEVRVRVEGGEAIVRLQTPRATHETRTRGEALFSVADPQPGNYRVDVRPALAGTVSYEGEGTFRWSEVLDAVPLPPPEPLRRTSSGPIEFVPTPLALGVAAVTLTVSLAGTAWLGRRRR